MERRNCQIVIKEMLELIPKEKSEFIEDLNWNYEDAKYKAPEETLQWIRTAETLQKHIPIAKEDWEFTIVSIFTTKSVEEIRDIVNNINIDNE